VRAIDQALVDEVWDEMRAYPPGRAATEARAFIDRQPHVAAFCGAVSREFDLPAQKAALGVAFLLFKVLEASLGAPVPPVSRPRLGEAYAATTEWLERWEGADPRIFLRHAEGGGAWPQPNLLQYLLVLCYGGDPESAEYDAEVKASLFLLLKTVADALDLGGAD
jgi:hypothetical protein